MARRIRDRILNAPDKVMMLQQAFEQAAVPGRYRAPSIEAINQPVRKTVEDLVERAPEWLGEGKGFVLSGPLNAGKSSVAGILLREALYRCETGLWLAARDIPGVIFRDTERNKMLNEQLRAADVLVIDDLGAESFRADGAGGGALETAIRIMYDSNRSVLVTTNLAAGQLANHYPEPVVSVLGRITTYVPIVSTQWPAGPRGK